MINQYQVGFLFDLSKSMMNRFTPIVSELEFAKNPFDGFIKMNQGLSDLINLEFFSLFFGAGNPKVYDLMRLLTLFPKYFNQKITFEDGYCEKLYDLFDYYGINYSSYKQKTFLKDYLLNNGDNYKYLTEDLCEFIYYQLYDNIENLKMFYNKLPEYAKNEGSHHWYDIFSSIKKNTQEEVKLFFLKNFTNIIEPKIKNIMKEYSSNRGSTVFSSSKQLNNILKKIEENLVLPLGYNLFDFIYIFKSYFFSEEKSLEEAFDQAFKIFEEKKKDNYKRLIILVTDGPSNNIESLKKKVQEKKNSQQIEIFTVHLSTSTNSKNNQNTPKLYYKLDSSFSEGTKFLFDISNKANYTSLLMNYFIKASWDYPAEGEAKFFFEIPTKEAFSSFKKTIKNALTNPNIGEKLLNFIANAGLKKYIDSNVDNLKVQDQGKYKKETGTCWLHAITMTIYLSSSRIFGRKIKPFDELKEEIRTKVKHNENGGANRIEVLKVLKDYRLSYKEVDEIGARKSIMRGHQCYSSFRFTEEQFDNWDSFFRNNPTGILKRENVIWGNAFYNDKNDGHAVILTEISPSSLKFLNSWGKNWGNNGYFSIENSKVFDEMYFYDIYTDDKTGITNEERELYDKYYIKYMQKLSKIIFSEDSLKTFLEKELICPKCGKKYKAKEFTGDIYKGTCPNGDEFSIEEMTEDIAAAVYINYILLPEKTTNYKLFIIIGLSLLIIIIILVIVIACKRNKKSEEDIDRKVSLNNHLTGNDTDEEKNIIETIN